MSDTRKAAEQSAGGASDGHDAERRTIERKAKGQIQAVLQDQLGRIMGAVFAGMAGLPLSFWEDEKPRMVAAMLPILAVLTRKAIRLALGDLDAVVHVGIDEATLQARLAKWARDYSYSLIKDIDATTQQAVRETMTNWALQKQTTQELRDALEPAFGPVRAQMIAETETTRAYSAAHREAWRASGVIEAREWRTASDERVCPICGTLNEQQAVLGEPFVIGEDSYDDPPAHPRCRCWTVPVIREVARLG